MSESTYSSFGLFVAERNVFRAAVMRPAESTAKAA